MASIFELTALEKELDSKLFVLDETDESDSDEIQLIMRRLESVHAKIESRLLWAAKMEQGTRSHAESIQDVNKKRKLEEQRAFKIADFWFNYVKQGMTENNLEIIENEEIIAKIGKSPAILEISDDFDMRTLPQECYNVIPEEIVPDKNAIKRFLKGMPDGIPGLTLVAKKSLRIK